MYTETDAYSGEGGDFRLELRNRRISRMLGPGVPKNKDWVETCRNVDNVKDV